MDDQMKKAMESGVTYQMRLEPPPADGKVAHEQLRMYFEEIEAELQL